MQIGGAFIDDGCTLFVDEWRGINIRPCCDEHDMAFHHGSTFVEFITANLELAACFLEVGVWELVIPAFILTCTVGYFLFRFGVKGKKKDEVRNHSDNSTKS